MWQLGAREDRTIARIKVHPAKNSAYLPHISIINQSTVNYFEASVYLLIMKIRMYYFIIYC